MSVFKKRDRWWIHFKAPNGKYRRVPTPPGANHALARRMELKLKLDAAEEKEFPRKANNNKPFRFIAAKYFELHGPNLRSCSWQSMLKRINAYLGDKPVGKITPESIQHFYNLTEAETSVATANRYLSLIQSIFNKSKAWGHYHGENPCSPIKKKPEPNHRNRYLLKEEIQRLMAVCHPRLKAIVACALMTGMRRGELLALAWQDIDFTSNAIQILYSKSTKPRQIPILPQLRQLFWEIGPKYKGSVFELPEITLRRYYNKALHEAQISDFTFHDLRHTFASHFIMKTGDLPTLQKILGHANIQMTLRYAHLCDQHMAAKMSLFGTAMPIEIAPKPAGIAPCIAPPALLETSKI